MPETVEYLDEYSIILVTSYDHVSIEVIQNSLDRVKYVSKEKHTTLVLVDASKLLSFPDILGAARFTDSLPRGMSFAVIPSTEAPNRLDNVKLFSKMAPGLVEFFQERDVAIKWLLEKRNAV